MTSGEKQAVDDGHDAAATAESRLYRRRSVLWPAKLTVGRHDFTCQIWNLSLGGARVRLDLPLQEGTKVTLAIAGREPIPATVAWQVEEGLGVAFDIPTAKVKKMFADRLHVLGLDGEA